MRSSTILTLIGATLAVASPVHQHLHKKAIVWDVETVIEYVTVTDDGHLPTSKAEPSTVHVTSTHWVQPVKPTTHSSKTKKATTTTTSTPPPPPPPAPTTSSTSSTSTTPPPPPPPATTEAPAPTTEAPAVTTEAPAPAPETTIQAAVFAATSAAPAPVVETPTSSVVAPVSNPAPSDYASTGVHYHNLHRANHSAPAVTWDTTLAGYAQQVANKCVFAHDLTPGGGGYGQNIDSVGYSAPVDGWNPSDVLANSITNDWYYAETAAYADLFGQSSPVEGSAQFLHFTQIVWKSTTTIGCASAACPLNALFSGSYGWFTVCNYGPAGNYVGEFATEVTKAVEGAGSAVVVPAPWNA